MRIAARFLCALIILIWAPIVAMIAYACFIHPSADSGGLFIFGSVALVPIVASALALRMPPQDFRPGLALTLSACFLVLSVLLFAAIWWMSNDGCGDGPAC